MNPSPLTLALSLLALASPLVAADLQALLDNSPFGKPSSTASAPEVSAQAPLEFRSVVVEDDGRYFSVFDPTAQRGYWLSENGKDGDIRIDQYDEQSNELTVNQAGRTMRLTLKTANIVAGGMPTLPVGPTMAANGGSTPSANRPSTVDARRLEAVAAEVRRRRALRQAAASGTPTPPAP